jgi:hypothetical protein
MPLLFPVWVFAFSIHVLVVTRGGPRPGAGDWAAVPNPT